MTVTGIFIAGADALGFAVAALLFLRAWRRTQDFLFATFGGAFALFALNEFALVTERARDGDIVFAYCLRLSAFAVLIAAIIHKNLGPRVPRF